MSLYPVAEYFVSINGEGLRAGKLAAFIRLRTCNLHCSYCDTRWANSEDAPCQHMSTEDLLAWLEETEVRLVTLTGGEPLLNPETADLIDRLGEAGYEVEVETNGSIDIGPFAALPNRPSFTLDYKCPGSGMEEFMLTENYRFLISSDTVKFVVSSLEDLEKAEEICRTFSLNDRCHIFLSPVFGRIEPREIVEYLAAHSWNEARLQLQLHKYIWPPDQRGV